MTCCCSKVIAIKDVMQTAPHSIAAHETLETARKKLREFGFRHLPVQEGGTLLGVISDRDITRCLAGHSRPAAEILVKDSFTEDAYIADPDDTLQAVAQRMADDRIGCALVVSKSKLIGIFTTVDACRQLAELAAPRQCECETCNCSSQACCG